MHCPHSPSKFSTAGSFCLPDKIAIWTCIHKLIGLANFDLPFRGQHDSDLHSGMSFEPAFALTFML